MMNEENHELTTVGLINEAYCQRTVQYNGKEFEVLIDSTGRIVDDPTEIVRLCNNGQALEFYSETGKVPDWYELRGE